MLHVLGPGRRAVAGTVQEDGSENEPPRGGGGEHAARAGVSPPRRGGEQCTRAEAKTNLRAVAGESMLRALEPAHRAVAGNNAS